MTSSVVIDKAAPTRTVKKYGSMSGDQSLVGISSDAVELCWTADIEPVPDVFPELRLGIDLRGYHHHADQRARGVRAGTDAVLGLRNTRDRRVPDLPYPRHAAVYSLVQDVRGVR